MLFGLGMIRSSIGRRITGGGTIGSYTSRELLQMGYDVDVIALEPLISDHPHLPLSSVYGG